MRIWLAAALLVGLGDCRRTPAARGPARARGPTVTACGAGGCPDESGAPRSGGELVVHVEAEPSTLCDLIEHDAFGRWIVENEVQETLLEQDPWTGAIGGRLAERVDESDGGRTLAFHLRQNVTWHDGQPFSAADVAFTLARARDPAVGADQRADLDPVSAVETPDAATVILRLARAAPFLRQALSHLALLPEHLLRDQDLRRSPAARAPVGTGPFRFVRWRAGDEIVLERNDHYWGKLPHLDRLVFKIVRDRQVAYELAKRGEIDVMWRLPPSRVDEARREPRLAAHRLIAWTPRAYYFVVYNTQRPPLGDPRVRRALSMLVDRTRFLHIAFADHARPVTGPYAPDTPSYDPTVAALPYDPAAARALLAAAGVHELKLTFLVTSGSRTVEQLATLLAEDFARAGVTLEVATVDFALQLDRLRKHAFDLSSLQWFTSIEQDNYGLFHSSQAGRGQNYGAWANPAADALLDRIRLTDGADARHALDRELHRLVHQEQPYAFLAAPEVQTLIAPRVHGLRPSTDGFRFAEAWVDGR